MREFGLFIYAEIVLYVRVYKIYELGAQLIINKITVKKLNLMLMFILCMLYQRKLNINNKVNSAKKLKMIL